MSEKLIHFDNGLVSGIYYDTGKKPTIDEIREQMRRDYNFMEKYDLWDYFDDEYRFERHLIIKWNDETEE